MDSSFAHVVESLHPSFARLTTGHPLPRPGITHPPKTGGVYLLTEAGRHLYVGRSRNLRNRFDAHRSLNSRMQSAPLAVALARQATGLLRPTYAPGEGSWAWLREHPPFMSAFNEAKARVRAMEFRYVEETDAIRQTVLEVYCAVVLATPYNKFETT